MTQQQTTPVRRIIGPTILLGSGTYFDFDNPEGSELTIEDVAYGLAFQSRFSGQCVSRRSGKRAYYSVAQHCVIVAGYAEPGQKLAALMHEVGEATCNDMSSPLKSQCPDYKRIEKRCECGKQDFRRYLMQCHDLADAADDERVNTRVRHILNIRSRAELNTDHQAAARWKRLRRDYYAWKDGR